MDLVQSLIPNILTRLEFLKSDFIGLTIDPTPFLNFVTGISISIFFIILFLVLGYKIYKKFLPTTKVKDDFLVYVAIGSIIFGSGISLLGFLNLLTSDFIILYLFIIFLLSFMPLSQSKSLIYKTFMGIRLTIKEFNKNKLVSYFVYLFILIAIINLLNPEVREDQYHVDFPKMYIQNHSIMVPPREQFQVSASPMLSEMTYIVGIFLTNSKDSARCIHFAFYLLSILTIITISRTKKKFIFAPLIFVSAPVVIHETSSMYVDFQWIFYFLLSAFYLIKKNKIQSKEYALSGLLLGAMVASKLWTIVFIPVSIIYIFFIEKTKKRFLNSASIFMMTLLIPLSIWLWRAFVLTGNPLYPAFFDRASYVGINYNLLNILGYINVFSPLLFIGMVIFVLDIKKGIRAFKENTILRFLLLIGILYLFIRYPFGRYLFGLYVFAIFLSSYGIANLMSRLKILRNIIFVVVFLTFSYYFLSSILILPYSIGFSNKNKYLSRILVKDASSYYDFEGKFDKYINKNDLVATHKVFGFYYAKDNLKDLRFITDDISFSGLKKKQVTKLFIRGGDINYFCKDLKISDCASAHYDLISSYSVYPTFYLYAIK